MQRKENKLLSNRKLKDFYQKYNSNNGVSVFTMVENATQLKQNAQKISPNTAQQSYNPIYRKILAEKLA